jgi:preprotein translocase subunit YajC
MFITQAWAQEAPSVAAAVPPAPPASDGAMLLWNVGFIGVMVVLFYLLLIRPQQMRFKEHSAMLGQLKKGDKVVLQSGMIGTIDAIANDNAEMTVEFLAGHKAQVLRSAIAGKYEQIVKK